jgi:hypothetical protein
MAKIGWIVGGLCAAYIGSQVLPVSRLAIQAQEVTITGATVLIKRSFPADIFGLPRPRLSYVETVRGLTASHNDGHSCADRGGPFRYDNAKDAGTWKIEWAAPCLSDPFGYTWEACWTWHLGSVEFGATCKGIIVLGSARNEVTE